MPFRPAQRPHPPLYFGGSSEAGHDVASRTIDKYLSWGEPPKDVAAKFDDVRRRAERAGAKVTLGVRLHVIVRETNAEAAWAAANRLIERLDDATIASAQRVLARMDSVGQARMSALHGGRRDRLEVSPNLWAGVGLVRGGAGTALVGDPDTVAERIDEYRRIGADTFIFSGYPHLEEAYRVAELLLPRLPLTRRTGGAREAWSTPGRSARSCRAPARRPRGLRDDLCLQPETADRRHRRRRVFGRGGRLSSRRRRRERALSSCSSRARCSARGLAYGGDDPDASDQRAGDPHVAAARRRDPFRPLARNLWRARRRSGRRDRRGRLSARPAFGRYVDSALRPWVEKKRIVHVADSVVSASRTVRGWTLRTVRGEALEADLVVLATTHPGPGVPAQLVAFRDDPRLVADGLADDALNAVESEDRVLIVGAGLTAADVVCSLDVRGHKGAVSMISRRGLRARSHPQVPFPPEGDFVSCPARRASTLVAEIRRAVLKAVTEGRTWHPVLDAVRAQGGAIWGALDPEAQGRVVRHLRPFWDAHRFRAAPQVDAVLDRKIADGSLEVKKARLGAVDRIPGGFVVTLVEHRVSVSPQTFDRIVVATGPAHRDIVRAQTYLTRLAGTGAVTL